MTNTPSAALPPDHTGNPLIPDPRQIPVFPEEETPSLLRPCTFHTCTGGHSWVPRAALSECPGCHAPVLALEMRLCPICNEPALSSTLRAEHATKSMGLAAACQGEPSRGDRTIVHFSRQDFLQGVEGGGHTPPIPTPMSERKN